METPSPTPPQDNSAGPAAAEQRRGFLAQAISLVLGTVTLLVPAVVGIVSFLNPLRQHGQAGRFMRLTSLDVLPEDGTPRKFPVIADRTDAWNRFPNEPIGAVFLRRVKPDKVEALQVVCPHAGCSIQYEATDDGGKFFCPCHSASFDLSGKRLDETSPSPRDLDTLDVKVESDGEVLVKFQSFETGTAKKVVKA
ncbi:MAG: Rieske 2Fe-2S domain-containing protein [Pirellulales bacterium]|nr:Rieske 2Fe-2S domain-containing protein [Pirellulales bacterium]